jgi:glutamate-ammonia-ligase adenylyltransferase
MLPAKDVAMLIRADHAWRTVQDMLRITVGRDAKEMLPEASARPLLRAMQVQDLTALRASLEDLAAEVRAAFVHYVGTVGK